MFIDFFLNFTIITTLFFLFHQYIKKSVVTRQSPRRKKIGYGILMGIFGALLMQFTIELYNGLIMDLRHVPLMCAALYAGPLPTIIAALILASVRLSIGTGAAAVYALAFLAVSSIGYIWIASRVKQRWLAVGWMMLLSNVFFSFMSFPLADGVDLYVKANALYWFFSFMGGYLTLHTNEYLCRTKTMFKDYEQKAHTDPLTGLNNVRSFDAAMNEVMVRVQKQNSMLALAMIDIDFFKNINDTYGHTAGDEILKQLGHLLRTQLPNDMIVSRNGGEEFTVIMEQVERKKAFALAEQIRQLVEMSPFSISGDQTISITVSIGIAFYPDIPIQALYRNADAALYNAKRSGRNAVCVSSTP